MKLSIKFLSTSAVSALAVFAFACAPTLVAAAPQLTIQQERAAHPRLVKAINEMRAALIELRDAPHDFGGNKAAAMKDTELAIHSLKKALYYRLKMDDQALDKAQ